MPPPSPFCRRGFRHLALSQLVRHLALSQHVHPGGGSCQRSVFGQNCRRRLLDTNLRSSSKNDKSRRRRNRQAARRDRSEQSAVAFSACIDFARRSNALLSHRLRGQAVVRPRQPHLCFQANTFGRGRRCRFFDPSRAKEMVRHKRLHADVF